MRLLASVRLGRLASTSPEGPHVLRVNHSVLEGTVALEADELDDRMTSGWSVLVRGRAEHVEDRTEMADLFRRMSQPWAPGSRPLVARVGPAHVTGRRFLKR
jgi:hypothetical protein